LSAQGHKAQMLVIDTPHRPRNRLQKPPARYSLQAFHPATGKAIGRRYATIEAALDRGAALMQGGYCFEIWSPDFLEKPTPSSR
jgi:hypothetical protein